VRAIHKFQLGVDILALCLLSAAGGHSIVVPQPPGTTPSSNDFPDRQFPAPTGDGAAQPAGLSFHVQTVDLEPISIAYEARFLGGDIRSGN
jgi:hypothetical protein